MSVLSAARKHIHLLNSHSERICLRFGKQELWKRLQLLKSRGFLTTDEQVYRMGRLEGYRR